MKASKSSKPAAQKRPSAKSEDSSPIGPRSAEVVLDVDIEKDRVHLVLANCGDAVATDVQVKFSRALVGIGGSIRVSDLPIFTKLGVLRPGRVVRIFWDAAPSLLGQRGQAAPFVATVSWSERSRGRQQVDYHHDLSIYRQLPEALD
jgi:hypothetical protein